MKIFIKMLFFVMFMFLSFHLYAQGNELNVNGKYLNCELGDLVGDDVKRVKISKFFVDYHSADMSQKQAKNLGKECIKEGIYTQYQMDCCLRFKMFPED